MNIRDLCPKGLFPLAQRLRALPDIVRFDAARLTGRFDPKRVVMYCPSRDVLSGNCLFLAEELKKHPDYTLQTVLEHDGTTKGQLLKLLATSGIVIVDDYARLIYPLRFSKATRVVQVWHSTGAFKRMGFARMGRPGSTKETSLTHRNYTDVIVSSPQVVKNFEEAFGVPKDRIFPLGVPRTDFFFDRAAIEAEARLVREQYPAIQGKKLVLFAPTFRGDTRSDAHYPAEFLDIPALLDGLPEEYILGLKLHPFITEPMPVPAEYAHRVVDFSGEREINRLLFAADLLITDYSSVIFEYAFLDRPIVFYVPDLEIYDRDRSFFYPMEDYIYGSKVTEFSGLLDAILHPEERPAVRQSFFDRFLASCDGHATRRVVEHITGESE